MSNWKHKDIWKREGKDFLIEVSRHEGVADGREGTHRWAVYAYIYPAHPHFGEFAGDSLFQDATADLPGHSYCSYLRYHANAAGEVTSVQVGWDYHHDGDWMFTHDATKDDALRQFRDADALFDALQAMTEAPAQPIAAASSERSEGDTAESVAAIPIADAPKEPPPQPYRMSRDYEALYKLLCEGGEALGWATEPHSEHRYAQTLLNADVHEDPDMGRSVSFGDIYLDNPQDDKSAFIAECQRLNLEYVTVGSERTPEGEGPYAQDGNYVMNGGLIHSRHDDIPMARWATNALNAAFLSGRGRVNK